MELSVCVICFLRKDETLIGRKTLIQKIDNKGTICGGILQEVGTHNGPTCPAVAGHTE